MTANRKSPLSPPWRATLPCWIAGLTLLLHSPLAGQEIETPNDKAGKYHGVLVKRPSPGYLFDRFFDAWLDTGTVEGLESWLKARADAGGATSGDRMLLAFFHAKQSNDLRALEVFREALAEDPKNAEAWFQKAEIEARTLDFVEAIKDLEKAAAAEPKPEVAIEIGKFRGRLLVRSGDNEAALEIWKGLLDANPDDDELHEDVIELQIAEGLYDEAVETSQALVEKTTDPYLKVVRQLRTGDIYQRSGKRDEALEAYAGTLGKVGQGTWIEKEVLAQIEQVFRREDDLVGLVDYFGDLIGDHSQRLPLRQRWAELQAEIGREDEAIAAWEELLKLTPGERRVREAFIGALANLDRIEEAVEQMKALVALHPDDPELLIQLAALQADADDGAGAAESLAAFLAGSDGSEYAHLRTARLMQSYGLVEEADGIYQKLLVAFPDSIGAKETYAGYLFDSERKDEALKIWKALGESGDARQAVRVARTLGARRETGAAFEMLKSRFEELKNDPVFLGQLAEAAMQNDAEAEAIPWVRRRVMLANSAIDLSEAVGQASRVIGRAEQVEAITAALENVSPRTIQETCLLAELLDRGGRPEKADGLLAGIGGEDAALALSQQVRMERERRDWHAAAEAMEKLVNLPGGRKSAHVQELVNLYDRAFKSDEALKWIGEWKKLSPGSVAPWLKESEVLTLSGKFDEAVETLRSAAQRFEDSPEIRARLGEAYYGMGKLAETERIYWRLYEDTEDPVGKGSWVQRLAELANETGRTQTLIDRFEERRRGNRTSVLPLLALSEIYRITNNYEERRRAILEATRLQPKDVGLLHQLASLDEAAGGFDSALKILNSALEFDRTDRTRRRIVRLHFMLGDFEKGFAAMRETLAGKAAAGGSAPSEAGELMDVYDAIVLRGEWERAAEFLGEYLEQYPDDYRLHYLHAVALEESENFDAAREAFLKVLNMDRELPKPPGAARPQNRVSAPSIYYGYRVAGQQHQEYLAQFPEEALEIRDLMQGAHTAYSYRSGQTRGRIYGFSRHHYRGGYSSRGTGSRATVQPPGTVEAVRPLALSHLLKLIEDADEKERAKMLLAVRERGVPEQFFRISEVMKEMEKASRSGLPQDPTEVNAFGELLLQEKEDEVYQAIWLLFIAHGVQQVELAENAVGLFREKRPELAFTAAMFVGNWLAEDEDADRKRALIDEAIAMAGDGASLTPMRAQQIAGVLMTDHRVRNPDPRYGMAAGSKPVLSSEQLDALKALLLDWESQLDEAGRKQNFWVNTTLLSLLAHDEDLAPWVDRLERVLEFHRDQVKQVAPVSQSSMMAMMRYQMMNGQLLGAPPFPPTFLPDYPAEIYALFVPSPYYGYSGIQLPKKEVLASHIDDFQDPVLKFLAAWYCELPERVDAIVGELEKADPPDLNGLLIAGGHAIEKEEKERASELFAKARNLPSNPTTTQLLDAALVNLAMEAEEGTPRYEAGRSAVIRLKTVTGLEETQKRELAQAMEKLGMKDEAAKFRSLSNRPRVSSTRSQLSSARMSQSPDSLTKKIETMIEQGNRAGAVKLAVRQLEQMATGLLGPNSHSSEYELRRMRQKLRARGLAGEILEAARPDDDAKSLERVKFGALCDLLGENKTAIEIYEAVLSERPEDDSVRLRLIVLLAMEDAESALSHLEKIRDTAGVEFLSNSLSNMLSSSEKFEEKFNLAELAVAYLEGSPEAAGHQFHWVENVRQQLSNQMHAEDMWLPSLFNREQQRNPSDYGGYSEAKFERIDKRRRELHNRLCEAMIRNPQMAASGFARSAALRLHEGGEKTRAEVAGLAKKVILEMAHPAFIGNHYHLSPSHQSYGSSSSQRNEIPISGPIEVLCEYAWKEKKPELIEEQLLPELEKETKRRQVADAVKAWAGLYFCEPEKYGEAIDELNRIPLFQSTFYHYEAVVDVWAARELDFDLEPKMLEPLEKALARGNYQEPGYLGRYASVLAERGEAERVDALIEKLSEIHLGPKEQRPEFIKKNYNPRNWQAGTANGRIHSFMGILNSLGHSRAMTWTVLDQMLTNGLSDTGRYYEFFRPFRSEDVWEDPEQGMVILEKAPFLAPLDEYRDYSTSGLSYFSNYKQKTFAGMMLEQIGDISADEQKPYLDWIEKQDPKTFGMKLLAAALPAKDRTENVTRLLGEYHEKLSGLPEEKQDLLAALFHGLLERLPTKASESAVEGWAWVEERSGNSDADQIAKIMEAEDIGDLDSREYNFAETIGGILAGIVRSDPEQALEVYAKALEIVETSRTRRQWNYNPGYGRTAGGEILRELGEKGDPADWFAFQAVAARAEDLPPVELRTWNECRKLVSQLQRDAKTTGSIEEQLEGIDAAALILEEALGNEEPFCLAGPVLYRFIERYGEDTIEALLARPKEAEAGEHSQIMRELEMAARLRGVMQKRENGEAIAEMPEDAAAHYLAAMENEAVPLPVRLMLANFLTYNSTPTPPGELALASAAAMADAWEGDVPVYYIHGREILRSFLASEPRDEAWKEVAARLGKGFQQRHILGAAHPRLQYDPDDDTVDRMIGIYLRSGNVAAANQALSRFESRFSDFASPLFHFVRAGEYASAVRLLRRHQEKTGRYFGPLAVHDALLEKHTQGFLAEIEQPPLRMLAEIVIAGAGDPLKPGERRTTRPGETSPRSRRLQAAAGRFSEVEFHNPMLRLQLLSLLGSDVDSARVVAEDLRTEAEKIDIAASIDADDSVLQRRNLGIVEASLLLSMADGDADHVDAELKRIAEAKVEDSYDKRYLADRIFAMPAKAIDASSQPEETARALIPVCKRFAIGIEGLDPRSSRPESRWAQLTYAMVLGGEMNEFFPWVAGQGDKKKVDKFLADWRKSVHTFNRLLAARFKGRPVEERIAFFNDLVGQDWVLARGNPFMTNAIMNAQSRGLFTFDEIVEHGEGMAETNPRQGRAWHDLAVTVNRAGKLDQAILYWHTAIETAAKLKMDFNGLRFRTEMGKALFAKNRKEEAREAIEDIDASEFRAQDFLDLRKKLGMPTVKAAAAAPAKPPGKKPLSVKPADRIENLMAAEDIDDIGVARTSFDDYIGSFVSDLIVEDPGRAVEVFEKAVDVVARSRANNLWPRNTHEGGKTFAGDAMTQLQEHTEPVAFFGFQAELARSKKVPPFETPRFWTGTGTKLVLNLVWPKGEKKPQRTIEAVVKTLEEAVGNQEPFCLAAPVFFSASAKYEPLVLYPFLSDLEETDPDEITPMTREFEAAARLLIAKKQAGPMPPGVEDHYLATLKNGAIPVSARLALVDFLGSEGTPGGSRELVLANAGVIAEGWNGEAAMAVFQLLDALESFLKEERDDDWKLVGKELCRGFRTRYLSEQVDARLSQAPGADLADRMIGIAVGVGDNPLAVEIFERFENRFEGQFGEFVSPFFHFIRGGEFETAARILRDHPELIGRNYIRRFNTLAIHDAGLEKNAAAFIETVKDPSLRLLAEAVIANAPDVVSLSLDPFAIVVSGSPRSRRLQSVAEKFKDVSISDPIRRLQILTLLANDIDSAILVGGALREAFEKGDLLAALESRIFSSESRIKHEERWTLGVVESVLLLEMAEGNVDEAESMIEWIAGMEAKSPAEKDACAERINRIPIRVILGSQVPAETAAALIPLCQRLAIGVEGLESRSRFGWKERVPWAQLTYAMAAAGSLDEFFPWLDSMTNRDEAAALETAWKTCGSGVFRIAAEVYRGRPVEERIKFMNDFLGGDWMLNRAGPFKASGFQHAHWGEFFTYEELCEHGETMAAATPRDGHAWDDLARIYSLRGRMEEAVKHWSTAISAAEASGAILIAHRFRTNQAVGFINQGESDRAKEAIEEIDPDAYADKRFHGLRKTLGMEEANSNSR